ncbi:S1C family serine protease [Labrys wisconsinensis]|uniref:S1-C subfamily serine protease n=1 Tax=Labrys wisconsinensis TaxID=425677 RepID=A0ABU0JMY4_9HYPH|nr:S1C family serine protease [Labrys wisconsinensis]MDQ0474763.1 S1-C subfamily serine protease [Labrys wisconsinensis]
MDLEHTLQSIVSLHSVIPEDGFTASILGTERGGSGIVIRETGLVLTIGYLITEAEAVWLTCMDGRVVPAHALAYDQETGFGLVQALDRLDLPALPLGRASVARPGDPVVLAAGGRGQFVNAHIVAKQEFAGYWEYLLEEAIFTAPAHPSWGGAGLIDAEGRLLGVGSLMVQQLTETGLQDINMVVPIDLLPPILDDLLSHGQLSKPARPWLGVYTAESEGRIVVANVAERGPAAAAGLRRGDIVAGVRDADVASLADFYRKVWESGPAGTEIPIEVVRNNRSLWLRVKSADRGAFLRKPRVH